MITAQLQRENYRTTLNGIKHRFFADEPEEVNGTDTAPSPEELLDAALASCTAITLRMYADRKGWALTDITVSVTHTRHKDATIFNRRITLHGTLSAAEKERLLSIATACPVSKILEGDITIQTGLTD